MIRIITEEDLVLDIINEQSEDCKNTILSELDICEDSMFIHLSGVQEGKYAFLLKFTKKGDEGLCFMYADNLWELKAAVNYTDLEELKEYVNLLK
jgi:hypothetical protein